MFRNKSVKVRKPEEVKITPMVDPEAEEEEERPAKKSSNKQATIVSVELLETGFIRTVVVSNYSLGKLGEVETEEE